MLVELFLKAGAGADAFEELLGEAEFAVDPSQNASIVDLELAPRDANGRVRFTADVRILRPRAVPSRGLFLDVPNRGQSIFARMLEPGPLGPTTAVTEGFLFKRGFTVVTCGWQHDIPRGIGRFGLTAPPALIDGQPLVGPVTTTRQIDAPTSVILPDSTYAPANLDSASLMEHDDPLGPGRVIPRHAWQLTAEGHARYVFEPGKTYVLTYPAVGAPVTGVGLLALRDIVSHLRELDDLRFATAMGASQTGRLLRQFVALGLSENEAGRQVIDGVLAIAAGARFCDVNTRFAQPSSQEPSVAMPVDAGLSRARARGTASKLMLLNTSSEYCSSSAVKHLSAAVSHLTPDGQRDLDLLDDVRLYLAASTQHAPAPLELGSAATLGVNGPNTIDYKPFVRACVVSLADWVVADVPPPPSLYPRCGDGTLTPDLWPTVDPDGNEVPGIRHPDVAVPLATYTGWNPRQPSIGSPHLLLRATGSTIPFSRASILERYGTRDAFLLQIRDAAEALAAQRYVLPQDLDPLVAASAARWDLAFEKIASIARPPEFVL